MQWTKVDTHHYQSEGDRFRLVREAVSGVRSSATFRGIQGGNRWRVYCNGHHKDHKKCPSGFLIDAETLDIAKNEFEAAVVARKGWWTEDLREAE